VPAKAPKAVGPYSQGIAYGSLIFTSGQIPLNPESNTMPEGIEAQARQSLDNVKAILEASGSSLDKVLKVTIFMKDLNDFGKVNAIYATYFTKNPPARSCVQVARIPKDALIEIEAIAVK
jgi:2-iminobutanoate/2-iminopropanoate deaminase